MSDLSKPQVSYLDAAFIFIVSGAAAVWWPLALVTGAVFFVITAVVNDRRTVPDAKA